MTTLTERLESIWNDVNRMMEKLLDVATADDASSYIRLSDEELQDLINRVRYLEDRLSALQIKAKMAANRDR